MKALMYFFVMAVIVIAGCAKDESMFEDQGNLELKKAKVPVPFKANLYAAPDWSSDLLLIEGLDPEDPGSYIPSKLNSSGTATHLGKIDPEKSFYVLEKLVLFFKDGLPYMDIMGKGIVVGANGDGFEYSVKALQSLLDGNSNGIIEIIPGSGTGKLEGSTGTINTVSGNSDDGIWFKCEGYLVFE
jgi:hypothetical protein